MRAVSKPTSRISGTIRAPGDKSCSHRALMLAAAAAGRSEVEGLLEGDDVLNTARCVAALGAKVERLGAGRWRIEGVGEKGFTSPSKDLDFGNSGTGARLMMGLIAGHDVTARMVGDKSLSARPMERVLGPLREMGVKAETSEGGRLPATVTGGGLKAIRYAPPQASAQVKSAVLLAGLRADGETVIEEKEATRDHTERMLRAFGVEVDVEPREDSGPVVKVKGGQKLLAAKADVPGDPSSAAFAVAAAILSADGDVTVEAVMDNETRIGFFTAAQALGADIELEYDGVATGEELMKVRARSSKLKGAEIDPALAPSMIDEYPILAVLAAFAEGETIVSGAAELRVKESDRIAAICAMLRANGVEVEETADGFIVQGCGPAGVPGGGTVEARHDHRIAMSALVMGTAAKAPVAVDDVAMIATSYPDFFAHMKTIGADMRDGMVVAIDGTTASGKGTMAKRVAEAFGLPYLDTGLLYRAVAAAALRDGVDMSDEAKCAEIAARLELSDFEERDLRGSKIGAAASIAASHGAVRKALFDKQRAFAQQAGGAVLDGRDIGTVIAPDADYKFWVDADVAVRAGRRFRELVSLGEAVSEADVLAQLKERDERDRTRKDAPALAAEDAVQVDTSGMTPDEVVAAAMKAIEGQAH